MKDPRNTTWSGSNHLCRVRVDWQDYFIPRHIEGLGSIDHEEALMALKAK